MATGIAIAAWPTVQWIYLLLPMALLLCMALQLCMALNALDGMLAREYKMQPPLGQLLNELGDVISDAALYLPLAFHP